MPVRNTSPNSWTESNTIKRSMNLALKPDLGVAAMAAECSLVVRSLAHELCAQSPDQNPSCMPDPALLLASIDLALHAQKFSPLNFIHEFNVHGELASKGLKLWIETPNRNQTVMDYRVNRHSKEEGLFTPVMGSTRKMISFGRLESAGRRREGVWTYLRINQDDAFVYHHTPNETKLDNIQTARYRRALGAQPRD